MLNVAQLKITLALVCDDTHSVLSVADTESPDGCIDLKAITSFMSRNISFLHSCHGFIHCTSHFSPFLYLRSFYIFYVF